MILPETTDIVKQSFYKQLRTTLLWTTWRMSFKKLWNSTLGLWQVTLGQSCFVIPHWQVFVADVTQSLFRFDELKCLSESSIEGPSYVVCVPWREFGLILFIGPIASCGPTVNSPAAFGNSVNHLIFSHSLQYD